MASKSDKQSFWTTLPGILTGVAAVVTAIAGLIGALAAVGVFDADGGGNGPEPTQGNGETPAGPTSAPSPGSSPTGPDATVPEGGGVSVGPWSNSVGGLTVTVEEVRVPADGPVELDVTVDNETGASISLPLFGTFSARDDMGGVIEADPFASEWPESFAQGATRGTIRLEGRPAGGATTLRIDFSRVFGSFNLDAIGVGGIELP